LEENKLLPLGVNSKEKYFLEDIPCIKTNVSTQEIDEILRDCRA
jgi:hypothetical protein